MTISTYQDAQRYLESLIKPFHMERISGIPDVFNEPFGRMLYLLDLLDNPHKKFRSIVVSGTSGKGSTAYTIAHILTKAGYHVGLTTSPHLEKINERIQISQQRQLSMIPDEEFISLLNTIIPAIERMKSSPFGTPSYFEALLALCFCYFAQEKVELAVVEVGLEGKYDGTQVLSPLIFVYTNTSLDHTQMLGETVEEIAQEGISVIEKKRAKGNELVVVSGVTQPQVQALLLSACAKFAAKPLLLERDFSFTREKETARENIFSFTDTSNSFTHLHASLIGDYQIANMSLGIEAVIQLAQFGFPVLEKSIREALQTAFFPGRFEKKENIILDGAHNPAKMQAFITSLQKLYPKQKKIFILAFKEDKKIDEMLHMILPVADTIIVTEYVLAMDVKVKSSLASDELFAKVKALSPTIPVIHASTTNDALVRAQALATKEDLIIITGSLYLIGEMRPLLR